MKKISAIAAIALIMTACMDLSPKDQLSDAQVWASSQNFSLFANQFYSWTHDYTSSTEYLSSVSDGIHSDLRSDLVCASAPNIYSQGTNTLPASDGCYASLYKKIYYTNLLLKNAESFATPKDIAESVGEACFFRAYCHFELVQIYGDCILLTEPLDLDSKKLYGERDDRLTVINQIIEDLDKAAELLPETPRENGRLCKYTAKAFLSRVALYEGTWQKYHNASTGKDLFDKAVQAAKAVMECGNYSLFYSDALGGRDSYRYMFVLENEKSNPAGLTKNDNKEYILARRHDQTLKTMGTNVTHGALNNAFWATRKLAEMYRCQDGLPIDKSSLFQGYGTATSEFSSRDNRMNGTLMMNGQLYWNNDGCPRTAWDESDKNNCLTANVCVNSGYANYKWATEREVPDNQEGYDFPVIRYAEVLLNYAEALYERDGNIADTDLDKSLNLVRRRSNPTMTALSNSLVSTNSLDMLEEIRAERTVELFMEGFRIDDLKRWKTAETEMPKNLEGIKYTGTWFETGWAACTKTVDSETGCIILYDNRQWSEKNYLYPLPSDELQLNPKLTQNTGWEK